MIDPGASDPFAQTADAASALAGLKAPAEAAASAIDAAFAKAADGLAKSLANAAETGKLSLADLARAALAADAAAGASGGGGGVSLGSSLGAGLGDALASAVGAAASGARADGGPVTPGGAYLVGERGPELFRPSTSGDIAAWGSGGTGGGGMVVNVTVQGAADPAAFVRSEAQIAQALARATALGSR